MIHTQTDISQESDQQTFRSNAVGILRRVLRKIFESLDPHKPEKISAPCPECGADVSQKHKKAHGGKDDLIFFQCYCGHASAWYWKDNGAQLIYGGVPGELDDPD